MNSTEIESVSKMVIGVIENVNSPMLMYQCEKDVVKMALEKQIPKEVKGELHEYFTYGYCPNCNKYLADNETHCPDCGQKLKWSE